MMQRMVKATFLLNGLVTSTNKFLWFWPTVQGHLRFSIHSKNLHFLTDNPMIIQTLFVFNHISSFFHIKVFHKQPYKEHLRQVWMQSAQRFLRKSMKYQKLTDTHDDRRKVMTIAQPYGQSELKENKISNSMAKQKINK